MDPLELCVANQALTACGAALNIEERSVLEGSLTVLKSTSKLSSVVFWGKILGLSSNYYLAKGFAEQSAIGKRIFYWSKDGIDWIQLAELDTTTFEMCIKIRGRFTGDPAHSYIVHVPAPPAPEKKASTHAAATAADADASVPESSTGLVVPTVAVVAPPDSDMESTEEEEMDEDSSEDEGIIIGAHGERLRKIHLVEEKRLTAMVTAIDDMVAIAPRGAFLLTAEHDVVPNTSFHGLSFVDACKVGSFCHIRKPRTFEKRSLLDKAGLAKSLDFLDVLPDDIPAGMWSLTSNPATRLVTVKSLLWPGAVAYHLPGTPHHGHCYIGTAEKNLNLAFML